jgi:hypothetical protein
MKLVHKATGIPAFLVLKMGQCKVNSEMNPTILQHLQYQGRADGGRQYFFTARARWDYIFTALPTLVGERLSSPTSEDRNFHFNDIQGDSAESSCDGLSSCTLDTVEKFEGGGSSSSRPKRRGIISYRGYCSW